MTDSDVIDKNYRTKLKNDLSDLMTELLEVFEPDEIVQMIRNEVAEWKDYYETNYCKTWEVLDGMDKIAKENSWKPNPAKDVLPPLDESEEDLWLDKLSPEEIKQEKEKLNENWLDDDAMKMWKHYYRIVE